MDNRHFSERKKNEKLIDLMRLEPLSLLIRKGRLWWFGCDKVKHEDETDWIKRWTAMEADEVRQTVLLRKR